MKKCYPVVQTSFLALLLAQGRQAAANPAGAVVGQGSATFVTSGSHLTINTSDRALINWNSFNIGVGETTTFVQPSSHSVVWNQIFDSNPSQILGTLNANGYVILQNQNGFYVGGQASINTHGLIMTTAPTPPPDLSSSGPWSFNAPPPTASIINYGKINVGNGGAAFLIAHNVENNGTISSESGQIGLYAGKEVLVSTRPDGRGLSARVTLPEGSVNNHGQLIADAGTIELNARVVNQGGLVQANSVRNVNGTIELLASDAVNLSKDSRISAQGDAAGVSSGGKITIKSGNSFSDEAGSAISVAGGSSGGTGGELEISAANLGAIHSALNARGAAGCLGGSLIIDPTTITLDAAQEAAYNNLITSSGNSFFTVAADNILLNSSWTLPSTLVTLNLNATANITVNTLWTLSAAASASVLNLTAGNNITFASAGGIKAGNNWSLNLLAGNPDATATRPTVNTHGVYLNGSSFLDTLNGNITIHSANDVIVNSGAIRTRGGGNISVTADWGNVNSGVNINGFLFGQAVAPYYIVNTANLGGISTAAGGDVSIEATRGDITSFTPIQTAAAGSYDSAKFDAGAGAFGSQHGDVTIHAGGNVYGHYVLMNGSGSVTADNGNIGQPILDAGGTRTDGTKGFALSLAKGGWTVNAPKGNIYIQDVRNPNGIFGEKSSSGLNRSYVGYHIFDYDPDASASFTAGNSVEFTGLLAPHTPPNLESGRLIDFILPPSLTVIAGAGGFILDNSEPYHYVLYPSATGELKINTPGDFIGAGGVSSRTSISMAGGDTVLFNPGPTLPLRSVTAGLGSDPLELDNPNAVEIHVGGNLENLDISLTKKASITVGGDANNVGFRGRNLKSGDETRIDVAGAIYNSPALHFVNLSAPIASAYTYQKDAWDSVFRLAVDPAKLPGDTSKLTAEEIDSRINSARIFEAGIGFVYDPATLRLGFVGDMSGVLDVAKALQDPLTVVVYGPDNKPVIDPATHRIVTTTYYFFGKDNTKDYIGQLAAASAGSPDNNWTSSGYAITGPGTFKLKAGSVDLGNTKGIVSTGGAAIDLTSVGNISMLTSRMASYAGGKVTVQSLAGSIDLGAQNLFIRNDGVDAYGIYTSGRSDLKVTAFGDININGSRIATYNGGNIEVESFNGNVNVGSGGNSYVQVPLAGENNYAYIYGSGIVAVSLPRYSHTANKAQLPGNITVTAKKGNITGSLAGILQIALSGSSKPGSWIQLTAGTPAVKDSAGNVITPAIHGDIDFHGSPIIGGSVLATAEGDVNAAIISRQNAEVHAAQNFSGTLLAAGNATVSAAGSVSGTIIGVTGASVSGKISGDVLGQNVSVNGGASQSTLGTSATATAASQAAANQASSDTKEMASNKSSDEDDDKKKKGKKSPVLRRKSRVTVLLPKT